MWCHKAQWQTNVFKYQWADQLGYTGWSPWVKSITVTSKLVPLQPCQQRHHSGPETWQPTEHISKPGLWLLQPVKCSFKTCSDFFFFTIDHFTKSCMILWEVVRSENVVASLRGLETHHPEERGVSEGLVLVDGGEDAEDETCQNNEEPEEGQKYSEHQFLLPNPQIHPPSKHLVENPSVQISSMTALGIKPRPTAHTGPQHHNSFSFLLEKINSLQTSWYCYVQHVSLSSPLKDKPANYFLFDATGWTQDRLKQSDHDGVSAVVNEVKTAP